MATAPEGANKFSDLHRKLASIQDLLPEHREFLNGECECSMSEGLENALASFRKLAGLPPGGGYDQAAFDKLTDMAGTVFNEAWQFELDAIQQKVGPAPGLHAANEREVIERAHRQDLAGLALSGGGIRSATFNLGILQALAELGLLRRFDYLSTVSGGGYIGAWLSRWLCREGGNMEAVEKALTPRPSDSPTREAEEIRFLRQYSNYLAPQTGLFSADSWALFATYFRNTVLNLLILVAITAGLFALPHLLVWLVARMSRQFASWTAITAALVAVAVIAANISSVPAPKGSQTQRMKTQRHILFWIVGPLMIAGLCGSVAMWHARPGIDNFWTLPAVLMWLVAPGILYFCAWTLGWLYAQWSNFKAGNWPTGGRKAVFQQGVVHLLCAVVVYAIGAALAVATIAFFARMLTPDRPPVGTFTLLTAFGLPIMLCLFGLTTILSVGLVGMMYSEKSREWWSRLAGWIAISTAGWTGLISLALFGPALVAYVFGRTNEWWQLLVTGGWLGATVAGLVLGRSRISGQERHRPALRWVARLAPLVFSAGSMLLISMLLYRLIVPETALAARIDRSWHEAVMTYLLEHQHLVIPGRIAFDHHMTGVERILIVMVCLVAAGLALAQRVDINKFSLYNMYKNRLVRAYLGATNRNRTPHPFTGFDEKDDVHLDGLLYGGANGQLQRPLHILNATLNLVRGEELAWQTRKGANFTFSPAFCGFETPSLASARRANAAQEAARGCYRRTAAYRHPNLIIRNEEEPGIKLGTAMAVSGAAANPNMGHHSGAALGFLMTLFNVRLGRWFANPLKKNWQHTSPDFGLRYLLAELFGLSDARSPYLSLSDGGHFENLGVYELVRRRCRLIVVIDASADGNLSFTDLGNAIRKCYTDLHIQIDIDVGKIDLLRDQQYSKAHCVAGTIRYDRTDGARNGTLLYIKPSLLGNESAALLNYRKSNQTFPHQSTVDQFFDENQFESYRSLGYWIGMQALGEAVASAGQAGSAGFGGKPRELPIPGMCDALQRQWGPARFVHAFSVHNGKTVRVAANEHHGERRPVTSILRKR